MLANKTVNGAQVWQSDELDAKTGLSLFFKCELLQKTGAFKYRVSEEVCFRKCAGVSAWEGAQTRAPVCMQVAFVRVVRKQR